MKVSELISDMLKNGLDLSFQKNQDVFGNPKDIRKSHSLSLYSKRRPVSKKDDDTQPHTEEKFSDSLMKKEFENYYEAGDDMFSEESKS